MVPLSSSPTLLILINRYAKCLEIKCNLYLNLCYENAISYNQRDYLGFTRKVQSLLNTFAQFVIRTNLYQLIMHNLLNEPNE